MIRSVIYLNHWNNVPLYVCVIIHFKSPAERKILQIMELWRNEARHFSYLTFHSNVNVYFPSLNIIIKLRGLLELTSY
jgi:hypothetical protein